MAKRVRQSKFLDITILLLKELMKNLNKKKPEIRRNQLYMFDGHTFPSPKLKLTAKAITGRPHLLIYILRATICRSHPRIPLAQYYTEARFWIVSPNSEVKKSRHAHSQIGIYTWKGRFSREK
jgi:hypothetical protein